MLGVDALRNAEPEELVRAVGPTIDRYLTGDLGGGAPRAALRPRSARAGPRDCGTVADEALQDKLDDAPDEDGQSQRDQALRAVQVALLKELDTSISKLKRARLGESTREHLEILRSLLKAQVNAYLEHFVARNATLFSQTSVMYAGEVGAPGVISTTLRGLIEGGTLTSGQAAKLAQFINERRMLVIFGERATGKSTLLNALFELVSVDERFVALERGPDLPALKERSFCVRLTVDDDTDIAALFAKARRMQPGRLVIGEIHREEARHLFALMHSDEKGRPRLAALWSVDGLEGDELELEEVRTKAAAAAQLVAEA